MLLTLTDVFDVYPAYLSTGSVFFIFYFWPVKVFCHLPRRLVHFALLLVRRRSFNISPSMQTGLLFCFFSVRGAMLRGRANRPFATSDHVVQNPPCWRASSLLFPHWAVKTKRPEPVKLDLLLF